MRVTHGKLTRRLPRAIPAPGDLIIAKTCYCGTAPDGFFVAAADRPSPDGGLLHISRAFQRRREAVAAAWKLLADGGRLLDYQRGVLAEQPYLWRLTFRRDRLDAEGLALFGRRQRGERWLIEALMAWAGLPREDARGVARRLVARGATTEALTQTEIRQALRPVEIASGRVLSTWALVEVEPAEVLPAPLVAHG